MAGTTIMHNLKQTIEDFLVSRPVHSKRTCLCCKEDSDTVGVFIPYNAGEYGQTEKGNVRILVYQICEKCLNRVPPEVVEALLQREVTCAALQ